MYVYLMVCVPHLSLRVVIFSLTMVWISCPSVACGGMLGFCVVFVGVCCIDWGCLIFCTIGGGGILL